MDSGRTDVDYEALMWRILARFDHYIDTTNTKASLLTALNSAILVGIVLRYEAIVNLLPGNAVASSVVIGLLVFALLCTALSLFYTLNSIIPSLHKPAVRDVQDASLLFFKDVGGFGSAEDYGRKIGELDQARLLADLIRQAHALAGIAAGKFADLTVGARLLIYGTVPAIIAVLVTISADLLLKP